MHRFNKIVTVLLVLLISTASFGARKAKYVFLFIGDGMGFSHVSLTEAYLAQQRGVIGNDPLAFTQLPVLGMATTYSASNPITCHQQLVRRLPQVRKQRTACSVWTQIHCP